jgi:hypothetical protein
LLALCALSFLVTFTFAQGDPLQERVAALKQSMAENRHQLRQYAWTETTQLTLKDDQKPATQNRCRYGPDGKVQKTAVGIPALESGGGPIKKRVVEKKKGEMQEYLTNAMSLMRMYLPPDDVEAIEKARASGNIAISQSDGMSHIVISNYIFQGDQMKLTFDPRAQKITEIGVNTYMDDPKNAVTLQVRMASLADGTSYIEQMVLNCPVKKMLVTTTNSDYQKVSGMDSGQ